MKNIGFWKISDNLSFVFGNRLKTAFFVVATLMAFSGFLQMSLVSGREWSSLFSRFEKQTRRVSDMTQVNDVSRRFSNFFSAEKPKEA